MFFDFEKADIYVSNLAWRGEVAELDQDVDMLNFILTSNIKYVAEDLGMKKKSSLSDGVKHKPWYDSDCRNARKKVKLGLYVAKRNNFVNESKKALLQAKRELRDICNAKIKNYRKTLLNRLAACERSADFWSVINSCRPRSSPPCEVELSAWSNYLRSCYPPTEPIIPIAKDFLNISHPILDGSITAEELSLSLAHCENGKAPGVDGIGNSFYKHLPQNWFLFLLHLFNKILSTEIVPQEWGRLITSMIYKRKGPTNDPESFRPITLVNNGAKIFTQILCNWLVAWASELDLIPESQSGFRRGRSCLDNLFILNASIQYHLSKPNSSVYAIFVDFKGAFPFISHQLLWDKLHKLGLSLKMINIIRNFYAYAHACIRTSEGCTNFVRVSRGVLQGEVLSSYLFLLFIADMEKYLINADCRGLSVNRSTEILTVGYADDYVLLTFSPLQVSNILVALFNYCRENCLAVNTEKTKILIFTRSANSKARKFKSFKYGIESIAVVKSYSYLGITFSDSGSFFLAATRAISAANTAVGGVLRTIYSTHADSWGTYNKLLQSLVLTILFYGIQIWSIGFLDEVEKVQLAFFKSLLALPINTPNYAVRVETGALKLAHKIFSRILNWIYKIS